MRILYLSQYFPPEAGATQSRAYEMAWGLVQAGHKVTVIAEVPNHPKGVIFPDYRHKLYERSELEGIDVIRVWVKTSPVKTFRTRMAFYLSYMFNGILAGLFLARGRYDLIYATSPPLFVGTAALTLSMLRRLPLVFEVRDLWPQSAVNLGEIKNKHAIALAEWMENIIYHHSQRIITVTEGFRNNLIIRGIPENKIIHIPNGANTELFQNRIEAGATVRNSFDIGDSFLVLYAGIHGIAQGLEHVIKAAKLLRKDRRIKFLFVGEGPVKEKIAALSRHNDLDNVFFHGEVPRNDMPDFFSAADVALVPLKKLDIFKITIPSKLFDAWACECPVIMGIEGEAQHLLHKSGAGRFVEPENSKALTEAIQSMSSDRSSCRVMGTKGRAFVKACYSRSDLAHKLENVLKTISTKNV